MSNKERVKFFGEWSKEIDEKIMEFMDMQGLKTKREALRQILRTFFQEREVKNGKQK